jgi:hypothetical protein
MNIKAAAEEYAKTKIMTDEWNFDKFVSCFVAGANYIINQPQVSDDEAFKKWLDSYIHADTFTITAKDAYLECAQIKNAEIINLENKLAVARELLNESLPIMSKYYLRTKWFDAVKDIGEV